MVLLLNPCFSYPESSFLFFRFVSVIYNHSTHPSSSPYLSPISFGLSETRTLTASLLPKPLTPPSLRPHSPHLTSNTLITFTRIPLSPLPSEHVFSQLALTFPLPHSGHRRSGRRWESWKRHLRALKWQGSAAHSGNREERSIALRVAPSWYWEGGVRNQWII